MAGAAQGPPYGDVPETLMLVAGGPIRCIWKGETERGTFDLPFRTSAIPDVGLVLRCPVISRRAGLGPPPVSDRGPMPVRSRFAALQGDISGWRRDLHQYLKKLGRPVGPPYGA